MSDASKATDDFQSDQPFPEDRYVSLRKFLPIVFLLLISVVALLTVTIMNRSATSSIEDLAEVVMTRISERVLEKTSHYLASAANLARLNAAILQTPGADSGEEDGRLFLEAFNRATRQQLTLFPYIGLVYLGDEQGNHWLNKREQDGTIRTRVIRRLDDSPASRDVVREAGGISKESGEGRRAIAEKIAPYMITHWYEHDASGGLADRTQDPIKVYDPRLRPWYGGALEKDGLFWTDVYGWEDTYGGVISHQIGITVSVPVKQQQRTVGVVGIDIVLQAVSGFLSDMEILEHGRAFIVNSKGGTVGLPNYAEVLRKKEGASGVVLNSIRQVSDRAMAASYDALRASLALEADAPLLLKKEHVLTFPVDGQRHYGFFKPFASGFGLDWTAGVVIPEDDFLGDVKRKMRWSMGISIASILVMLLVGVFISRLITKPMRQLGDEVELIMNFDLAPTPPLETRFKELGLISFAFARMKRVLGEMVNSISVHAKTLDWSAEEFSNVALTLEDGTQTMADDVQVAQKALQDLTPEQVAELKELAAAVTRIEESVAEMRSLSGPVIDRAEKMTVISHELREILKIFRI